VTSSFWPRHHGTTTSYDQAFVEQKNGAVVPRLMSDQIRRVRRGRDCLCDGPRLYAAVRLYVNFFQPSFKLAEKRRKGAKVISVKALSKTTEAAEPRASHRKTKRRYQKRARMPSLDPHLARIESWLAAEPQLIALAIVGRLSERDPETFGPSAFDSAEAAKGAPRTAADKLRPEHHHRHSGALFLSKPLPGRQHFLASGLVTFTDEAIRESHLESARIRPSWFLFPLFMIQCNYYRLTEE
jgi:hypothetical protein